jgi:AsmA protein
MQSTITKSKLVKIPLALTAILLVATVLVPQFVNLDRLRPQLEAILHSSVGRDVHIGSIQLSFLAGGIRAEDVSIADDPAFSAGTFVESKSLGIGLSLTALVFSRTLHLTSLTLEEPRVNLVKSASGKWNFSTVGGKASQDGAPLGGLAASNFMSEAPASSMSAFLFDKIKIVNGTILLPASWSASTPEADPLPDISLQGINLDVRNASLDKVMSFVISGSMKDGGKFRFRGEAGPINRAAPEQTPFHALIEVVQANLAQAATTGSPSSLRGALSIEASMTSDGRAVHSEGNLHAEKLRLVGAGSPAQQPISLRYASDYMLVGQTGVVRMSEISTSKGTAHLTGTYRIQRGVVTARLKFSGVQLPLDFVQGVLPAVGINLPVGSALHGGTVTANLCFDGRIDRPITIGSAQIANARLSGFDLGSKLGSIPGLGGLHAVAELGIVGLSSQFRVSPRGTHISNFKSELSGLGSISGEGDVSASSQLQFQMVAHVQDNGMVHTVVSQTGLRSAPNDIPFKIEGTTSLPLFLPDLSRMAKGTATNLARNTATHFVNQTLAKSTNAGRAATAPQNNGKKKGFFGRLFGHRDKSPVQNAALHKKY